ncbi:MAG: transposase [Deltaproteobacteria bacterium]|nr:transposase [Deltaproteobacteria bacterium]MBF0527263.1 transposase [Deltaproteobacteria bacterium]
MNWNSNRWNMLLFWKDHQIQLLFMPKAVKKNLPEAAIVFDHFHVVKLYNDKLPDLRRKLYHEVATVMEK